MPKGKEQIADDLISLIAAQTTDDIDGANDVNTKRIQPSILQSN